MGLRLFILEGEKKELALVQTLAIFFEFLQILKDLLSAAEVFFSAASHCEMHTFSGGVVLAGSHNSGQL